MKHLLTIRHTETEPGDARARGQSGESHLDFARSMAEAGILIGREEPQRSATTARARGSYVIDVVSTDEALSWAARFAGAACGAVEVRPIWAWAGMGQEIGQLQPLRF